MTNNGYCWGGPNGDPPSCPPGLVLVNGMVGCAPPSVAAAVASSRVSPARVGPIAVPLVVGDRIERLAPPSPPPSTAPSTAALVIGGVLVASGIAALYALVTKRNPSALALANPPASRPCGWCGAEMKSLVRKPSDLVNGEVVFFHAACWQQRRDPSAVPPMKPSQPIESRDVDLGKLRKLPVKTCGLCGGSIKRDIVAPSELVGGKVVHYHALCWGRRHGPAS